MFNSKKAGQRIRDRRKELNLSIGEFAGLLDLSTGFVGLIERGERFVSADKLINISNLLNVSTDYILKGPESPAILSRHQEKLQYLIENVESKEEADFYIKLAFILKQSKCGPGDFDNICKTIIAFTSYAEGRRNKT